MEEKEEEEEKEEREEEEAKEEEEEEAAEEICSSVWVTVSGIGEVFQFQCTCTYTIFNIFNGKW